VKILKSFDPNPNKNLRPPLFQPIQMTASFKTHPDPTSRFVSFFQRHHASTFQEDEESGDFPSLDSVDSVDLLFGDISAFYRASNEEALLSSVRAVSDFFSRFRIPFTMQHLLASGIIPILIALSSEDPNRSLVRTSLRCLSAIATAFPDMAGTFLDMGFFQIFVNSIGRATNSYVLYHCINGIRAIAADSVELLNSIPPPSHFISLIGARENLCVPVGGLLVLFCVLQLPGEEVDMIVDFFVQCFLTGDDLNAEFRKCGREGLRELLMNKMLCSRHFPLLEKLPDLMEFTEEEVVDEEAVVSACQILSGLFQLGFRVLEFDLREVLEFCGEEQTPPIRIAAYELLEARATHCEPDTLESLCLDSTAFGVVWRGIRNGTFQIRVSSAVTLFQIIDGTGRLNDRLVCKPVIESLVLLLEDETWQEKAIRHLDLIFVRSLVEAPSLDAEFFFDYLTACDGIESITQILNSDDTPPQTKEFADRFLMRLK
jgi:hypothetical protein